MKKIIEGFICVSLAAVLAWIVWQKLPVIYSNAGYARYREGDFIAAAGHFEKALALAPADLKSRSWLAASYEKLGRPRDAEAQYREAVARDRHSAEDHRALVRMLLERKAFEEALTAAEGAAGANPSAPWAGELRSYAAGQYAAFLVNASFEAFAAGERPEAYRRARALLALDPGHTGHYILATFYVKDGKYTEACRELEEVARRAPDFAPALKLLGSLYFDQGLFDDAERAYRQALKTDQGDAVVYNDLGIICMNRERYEDALLLLRKAVALKPENANMRYNLASVYRDNGNGSEAEAEYERVIELVPAYRNVHNELGALYEKRGRVEDAAREYGLEEANSRSRLADDPDDPVALNDLAQALAGSGKLDEARASVQRAIALVPAYRQAYLNLAAIEEKAGQLEEAGRALKTAQSLRKAEFIDKAQRRIERIRQAEEQQSRMKSNAGSVRVVLKNGRFLEGRLKAQDAEGVEIEPAITGQGAVRISRESIERIDGL